jgi:hypothetical protein
MNAIKIALQDWEFCDIFLTFSCIGYQWILEWKLMNYYAKMFKCTNDEKTELFKHLYYYI